jgi:hypothetical protein
VEAGAEILRAVAFYASRDQLAATGHTGRAKEINRRAVRLAKRAAAGRAPVRADLSLTWMHDPKDPPSRDRVAKRIDEQLRFRLAEKPDFATAEALSYLDEALIATDRAKRTGLAAIVTTCFDPGPVSYDGHTPAGCARALDDAGADVVGVNCLRNPSQILPIAKEMRRAVTGPVAGQPSAYRTPPGQPDFTATPEFPHETELLMLSRRERGRSRGRPGTSGSTSSVPAAAPSPSTCGRRRELSAQRRRTPRGGSTTRSPCRPTSTTDTDRRSRATPSGARAPTSRSGEQVLERILHLSHLSNSDAARLQVAEKIRDRLRSR